MNPALITQKRITVRKAKIARAMSQETVAYTAEVLFDGKLIGYARNDGGGGASIVHRAENSHPHFNEAEAFAGTFQHWLDGKPQSRYDDATKPWMMGLDEVVDDLVLLEDETKILKRGLAKRIYMVKPRTERQFEVHSVKLEPTPENIARVTQGYPTAKILNSMPLDEALALAMPLIMR